MTGRRSQFLGLLCTGDTSINVAKLGADRVLRKSPKRAMPFAPLSTGAAKPVMKKELKAKKELLFELALELGYCLEKKSYFKREFSSSLARRLIILLTLLRRRREADSLT